MNKNYQGWTELQRWQEYARLKREWEEKNVYDEKAYNEYISKILKDLGL